MVKKSSKKSRYKPCPKCGNSEAVKIKYTLWGGHLGPKLSHRVRCNVCGKDYNGKTGRSISVTISIYVSVLIAIMIIIYLLTRVINF